MKYRYGVFPEIGFPGDKRYPEYYEVGPEIRKNEGCNTTYEEKVSDSTISRQMVRFVIIYISQTFGRIFLRKYCMGSKFWFPKIFQDL